MKHQQYKSKTSLLILLLICGMYFSTVGVAAGPTATTIDHIRDDVDSGDEYDDERTLLDTFGEVAKEYLTQKIIPETDPECKWDWRFVRCEPFCECDFRLKRGDYHLGRSCRMKPNLDDDEKRDEYCDPSEPTDNTIQLIIQRTVRISQSALSMVSSRVKSEYGSLQTRVCADINVTCSDLEREKEGDEVVLAWQQKLLCQDSLPECASK